ncbi:hypothetical protein IE81DRAFT_358218 [Ceraceosorus guamensis]|uniref:histidine kinase n=1 Tax=Ceraceosorus guamensis TaxID=1522189 RepID=A0A316VZ96_9BASI|nr:hypothetical protein IE81DRAFT_358218 [Ceraceosorus guamensis]PWN41733.1 hypothetical protein IE81DRAFT_358218 [Ceraceosorus guamensis]
MLDLDETLRALYFAPLPLIVLDNNRTVRLCNRPAEHLLRVAAPACTGQRFESLVAPTSRNTFTLALNEAVSQQAQILAWHGPTMTRVLMRTGEEQQPLQCDLSISAWVSTCQSKASSADKAVAASSAAQLSPRTTPQSVPAEDQSSPPNGRSEALASASAHHLPHESMFTISIAPVRTGERRSSPGGGHLTKADMLRESVLHTIEVPMLALNCEGTTMITNRAANDVLSIFRRQQPVKREKKDGDSTLDPNVVNTEIDLTWITENMDCYDENFEHPIPESEFPIYRATVLAQPTAAKVMGIENPFTGRRIVMEISGRPIRDNGGFGEHIGGLITFRDVTGERAKREEDIQEQGDAYFKQLCDAMPQLVWVTTPTGFVEWYSKAWYDYTGQDEQDAQGVGWGSVLAPEDVPETNRRWSHSLRTGEQYETAYRCKRKDGVYRWFLGRARPFRDARTGAIKGWAGSCTDIHDQVEALAASRQAQTQLESVINQAAMTLWAIDREGVVTVAEGPGVRQLKLMAPTTPMGSERDVSTSQADRASEDGMQMQASSNSNSNSNSNSSNSRYRHSMIGRSVYDVWNSVEIRLAIQKALAGESVVEEMEIEGRHFRTSYNPLRASDPEAPIAGLPTETYESEIIGVVGSSMDITERKRAQIRMEESLIEKSRALAAEGAAREASRLKSEFLANMSHEIRTPIAGVIGLSELLLDEKLTTQQRDYAETIQRSAEGLLTVINDVLDFSKVEIGKLDVERAPFNLEVVLRDQKRMLSFATQKKGLDFRDSVRLGYKGMLLGDAGRLRQVITNILTNAIKFTSEGYISLDVAEVKEDAEHLTVRFDVRDTGCGISTEVLSRLFQPFSQADPSTARRFGGTGLGLSISKNLVELMHGKIGLNSVEGQGSHAWFWVPFLKAKEPSISDMDEKTSAKVLADSAAGNVGMPGLERNPLSRPRKDIWILIAEDNLVNAQIASKNLRKMGFSCRTAENGKLALDELGRNTYDAVLMDCQMPEMDGYEATRLIRASQNTDTRSLPVIALTASAIKGDRERALEAGMNDYISKPVKRPLLESTLCRWLYDQDARQSLSRYSNPPLSPTPEDASPVTAAAVSAALGTSAPLSSQAIQASLDVGPSPRSQEDTTALGATGKSPGLSPSSTVSQVQRTLKVNTSDALTTAAELLAARRASDEGSPSVRLKRPPLGSRSHSHNPSSTTSEESLSYAKMTGAKSYQQAAPPGVPRMVRRSSREQGGMGRDLEGEVLKAVAGLASEPRLEAAMENSEGEQLEQLLAQAHAQAAGDISSDTLPHITDQQVDADGDSPMPDAVYGP